MRVARPGDSARGGQGALTLRMGVRVRISGCVAATNTAHVLGFHLDIARLVAPQSLSHV